MHFSSSLFLIQLRGRSTLNKLTMNHSSLNSIRLNTSNNFPSKCTFQMTTIVSLSEYTSFFTIHPVTLSAGGRWAPLSFRTAISPNYQKALHVKRISFPLQFKFAFFVRFLIVFVHQIWMNDPPSVCCFFWVFKEDLVRFLPAEWPHGVEKSLSGLSVGRGRKSGGYVDLGFEWQCERIWN